MARIVHIALKVEDLEKSTKFYEDVFGIYQLKTGHARGHTSRHMTEGTIDLALMTYDSEDEPEAKLSGAGPCIHHFGIEVEDRDAMSGAIEQGGGSIFSDKEEGALKFRAPDGCMAELVNVGRYKLRERSPKARIVHLALKVNDIEKATAFYQTVFGFKVRGTMQHGDHVSRHLTDGNLDIALMKWVLTTARACWRRRPVHPSLGPRGRRPRCVCRRDQKARRRDPVEARRPDAALPRARPHHRRVCRAGTLSDCRHRARGSARLRGLTGRRRAPKVQPHHTNGAG
jgi:lactoylglutathione lyase